MWELQEIGPAPPVSSRLFVGSSQAAAPRGRVWKWVLLGRIRPTVLLH